MTCKNELTFQIPWRGREKEENTFASVVIAFINSHTALLLSDSHQGYYSHACRHQIAEFLFFYTAGEPHTAGEPAMQPRSNFISSNHEFD